jgi:phosphate transport system permease protein
MTEDMATSIPRPHRGDLHTSKRAKARTRRRYYRQSFLKLAGVLAIAMAAFALVSLVYSVISRAVWAVSETHISLDIRLDEAVIDPQKERDPEKLYGASYRNLIRQALKDKFPDLGRSEKRKLYSIVSDGANYELRDYVLANPYLIGQTLSFELLADDDVDLFVKGKIGKLRQLVTDGIARPTGAQNRGSDITVYVQSNTLNAALSVIKKELKVKASVLKRQANDQKRAAGTIRALMDATGDPDKKSQLGTQRMQYESRYNTLLQQAAHLDERASRAGGQGPLDSTLPSILLKINGGFIKADEIGADRVKGTVVLPMNSMNDAKPGSWSLMVDEVPEDNRRIKDNQIIWLEQLKSEGRIKQTFNWHFLTAADASEPEEAGILGGLLGTFWTMLVTFILSFPVGVMAALYLEEFAPRNKFTYFIEININNLAAVPSIVFGLLGLAIFINFFGLPYSSSLVGGMVLALMTLPTVIIASRAAIKAVPPSIREAALGIGASKNQTVFHHVLPLAMPGILTGSIIGMAQALGETAPLLMIGMVAFIVDPPTSVTDSAASLPVLVYLWADRAELAFDMRTTAAIIVLLSFLVVMNGLAILLRKRFERRW